MQLFYSVIHLGKEKLNSSSNKFISRWKRKSATVYSDTFLEKVTDQTKDSDSKYHAYEGDLSMNRATDLK